MDGPHQHEARGGAARVSAVSSSLQCSIHHAHVPWPTYTELHHVIPQAWQVAWQPPTPWPNQGLSPDRTGPDKHPYVLWDARTIPLCRTGHGNVHFWLVAAMREIAVLAQAAQTEPTRALVATAWKVVKRDAKAAHRTTVAADIIAADMAIQRFLDAGGSLALLVSHRLWGEI